MADITLHFEKGDGVDADALAQALQAHCAGIEGVEQASSEVAADRVVGVDDVILVLTVSAALFGSGAKALEELKRLVDAAVALGKSCGAAKAMVEGRGKLVAPEHITESDANAIARAG